MVLKINVFPIYVINCAEHIYRCNNREYISGHILSPYPSYSPNTQYTWGYSILSCLVTMVSFRTGKFILLNIKWARLKCTPTPKYIVYFQSCILLYPQMIFPYHLFFGAVPVKKSEILAIQRSKAIIFYFKFFYERKLGFIVQDQFYFLETSTTV